MTYSEAKANAICGEWFDDWASLRRALVDEGLLRRNESGTTYERVRRRVRVRAGDARTPADVIAPAGHTGPPAGGFCCRPVSWLGPQSSPVRVATETTWSARSAGIAST